MTDAKSIGVVVILSSLAIAGEPANKPVTFAKDIAPIFQEKCQDCHRKESMAPMSLVTYEETPPDRRDSTFSERPVVERRTGQSDRRLGGCRRAARRP